ncbi:MAG: hypothetical protein HC804_01720 [Anaerolineae bacterium]|nr:hypothetical protein [Anaerolineae bacterium]
MTRGRGIVVTDTERKTNQLRLAAIMAQGNPAIEAPPACRDLADAGITPPKPPKEIMEMVAEPVHQNGATAETAVPVTDTAVPTKRKGKRPVTIPDERIREVHQRYLDLGNIKNAAQEFGMSPSNLWKRFKALGLPILPHRHGGGRPGRAGKKPTTPKPARSPQHAERVGAQTLARETAVTISQPEASTPAPLTGEPLTGNVPLCWRRWRRPGRMCR